MMKLDPDIAQIMSAFGWSPDRFVDASALVATLTKKGCDVFPNAVLLLQNFYGLLIELPERKGMLVGPAERIDLDPLKGSTDPLGKWQKTTGTSLVPFGEVDDTATLLVSSDGRYFLGYGHLWEIGKDLNSALRHLLFGTTPGTFIGVHRGP